MSSRGLGPEAGAVVGKQAHTQKPGFSQETLHVVPSTAYASESSVVEWIWWSINANDSVFDAYQNVKVLPRCT